MNGNCENIIEPGDKGKSPGMLLDGLCSAFERSGYNRKKEYADSYTKLLDASTLIFGSPNDPLGFYTTVDPAKGREILEGLKQAFDTVAATEKQRGRDALLFKQRHFDASEKFSQFSDVLGAVLHKLPKP